MEHGADGDGLGRRGRRRANDAATLLHTASGGDYAGETASVSVTVTDDDDVGLTLSTTALGVAEGDDGEYTVRLATQPTATGDGCDHGPGGHGPDAGHRLADVHDGDVEHGADGDGLGRRGRRRANDAATLLHTASGGDYAGETASVAVTVTDDETAGLTAVDDGAGVAEGDDGEYTVRLATQPTAQVTVAITGTASTDLTWIRPR